MISVDVMLACDADGCRETFHAGQVTISVARASAWGRGWVTTQLGDYCFTHRGLCYEPSSVL